VGSKWQALERQAMTASDSGGADMEDALWAIEQPRGGTCRGSDSHGVYKPADFDVSDRHGVYKTGRLLL
jgi:hypothetical protein